MPGGLGRNHFAVKLSFLSAQATAGNPEQIKIWTQPHVALEHRRQLRPRERNSHLGRRLAQLSAQSRVFEGLARLGFAQAEASEQRQGIRSSHSRDTGN